MEISVVNGNGSADVAIMRLRGNFDSEGYQIFDSAAEAAYRDGARYFVINLSEVPYMSSAGIRSLISLYKTLSKDMSEQDNQAVRRGIREGGYAFPNQKLVNPTDRVQEVLNTTGLLMYLGIYKDEQEALAAF
jgi:anti-anti-sigma factor